MLYLGIWLDLIQSALFSIPHEGVTIRKRTVGNYCHALEQDKLLFKANLVITGAQYQPTDKSQKFHLQFVYLDAAKKNCAAPLSLIVLALEQSRKQF